MVILFWNEFEIHNFESCRWKHQNPTDMSVQFYQNSIFSSLFIQNWKHFQYCFRKDQNYLFKLPNCRKQTKINKVAGILFGNFDIMHA